MFCFATHRVQIGGSGWKLMRIDASRVYNRVSNAEPGPPRCKRGGVRKYGSHRPRRGHMFIAHLRIHLFDHIVVAPIIYTECYKHVIPSGLWRLVNPHQAKTTHAMLLSHFHFSIHSTTPPFGHPSSGGELIPSGFWALMDVVLFESQSIAPLRFVLQRHFAIHCQLSTVHCPLKKRMPHQRHPFSILYSLLNYPLIQQ